MLLGALVRVVRLERTVSWSQTRRDTNFAIPGYSISAIIPRRRGKSKIFLSVVIPVVKAAFVPFSATGGNPANAGVARLCGVLPCLVSDTATALPKQARYQLRYTRLLSYSIRLGVFSQTTRATSCATPGFIIYYTTAWRILQVPKKRAAVFPGSTLFAIPFIRIASESAPKSPHPPGRIHSLESPPGESRPWHDAPAAGAFPGRWCSDTGSGEW